MSCVNRINSVLHTIQSVLTASDYECNEFKLTKEEYETILKKFIDNSVKTHKSRYTDSSPENVVCWMNPNGQEECFEFTELSPMIVDAINVLGYKDVCFLGSKKGEFRLFYHSTYGTMSFKIRSAMCDCMYALSKARDEIQAATHKTN